VTGEKGGEGELGGCAGVGVGDGVGESEGAERFLESAMEWQLGGVPELAKVLESELTEGLRLARK
jgi:hypothetical protein